MAGPFGLARDVAAAGIDFVDLLPGESIDVTASLDSVPSLGVGFTTVDVDASGEGVEIESIRGSSVFVAPPIAVLLLLLVVMFGALGVRAFRRHRLRDAETAQSDDSAGKSAQDILEHQPT